MLGSIGCAVANNRATSGIGLSIRRRSGPNAVLRPTPSGIGHFSVLVFAESKKRRLCHVCRDFDFGEIGRSQDQVFQPCYAGEQLKTTEICICWI
ncbi:MAG: hypothetical protein M2R45_02244 [Verrucomicrobia subdivision 3 bacterium]|nr:hypothetical protein [Limisphaerales bacterium]MCS1413970.1 hypothetical protein [Limisphaerales bacterium]